jgi:hypothetical protein
MKKEKQEEKEIRKTPKFCFFGTKNFDGVNGFHPMNE